VQAGIDPLKARSGSEAAAENAIARISCLSGESVQSSAGLRSLLGLNGLKSRCAQDQVRERVQADLVHQS
jgi:hypothetical protein